MLNKNLKYYRLKRQMSKKELASQIGVTPMAVTHYESGERKPDMKTIKAMAKVLGVKAADFLTNRNENLVFAHAEFRKGSKLAVNQQEYIREDVEEYMGRFFTVVDILGGEVMPTAPEVHKIILSGSPEEDAKKMRDYFGISASGPVGNLIQLLENRGILVYACDIENDAFSGMNGQVNERPYIIFNMNMSPERIRSTIAHEMAHFVFFWPDEMGEKEMEKMATAISGAFLFPEEDAKRELGLRRTRVSKDMELICREYGISMYLLVKRAALCGIITGSIEKDFYIKAGKAGWKKNEPVRSNPEAPFLFEQLVFRAVSENEITVQKGAELLKQSYEYVADHCFAAEE
ncbi:MAG: XRE family transcriptional regulator [Eubacteriales bacterium]|nr:XRE family transcriptional regulator [Eubacteriales bacterium]